MYYVANVERGVGLPHSKGDVITDEVKGWCPFTLLNTIYKIYAKLLGFGLQPFLPDIVYASHTRFMHE